MDELELLKKDWKKIGESMPKLSYDEIYRMILKRSSSIVKWIFYISIFELIVAVVGNLYVYSDLESLNTLNGLDMMTYSILSSVLSFVLICYFAVKFYKNYKAISSTDNTKTLMKNIIKTRKSVKNYIKISIIIGAFVGLLSIIYSFLYDENFKATIEKMTDGDNSAIAWFLIVTLVIIIFTVAIGIIWLVYQLLYGLLLRKLNKNYKELEKIDF